MIFYSYFAKVKLRLRHKLRSIAYSPFMQGVICNLVYSYMKLVFHSSRKVYIGEDQILSEIKAGKCFIGAVWHNRLMMAPFISYKIGKVNPDYKIVGLASRHGDGRFVSNIIRKFGADVISGSTRSHNNRADRGITISGFRQIFDSLKNNSSLLITPDGPRGPAQKINGKLIEISHLTEAPILPISVSASRFIRLNSWDKFYIPLPFSRICYYFGAPIVVDADMEKDEVGSEKITSFVIEKMNEAQEKSQIKVSKK